MPSPTPTRHRRSQRRERRCAWTFLQRGPSWVHSPIVFPPIYLSNFFSHRFQLTASVNSCAIEPRPLRNVTRISVHSLKVRVSEVGLRQIGVAQICAFQVCSPEICFPEFATHQYY